MAADAPRGRAAGGPVTGLSAALHRHPRLKLLLLLVPPLLWLVGVYLISLGALIRSAFWTVDTSGFVTVTKHTWSLDNYRQIFSLTDTTYWTIALRTLRIAAMVTVIDALIAFPLAYYMVRVASRSVRRLLFLAVLLPLWMSYMVRVYAWRLILDDNGALNWTLRKLGLGPLNIGYTETAVTIVFCYIWLPFMVLPVYTALERVPGSLLEASRDLGARGATTLRRVVLPLALPGLVAGSIFTFSLTLGDYITPVFVSNSQFIGNAIYSEVGVANDLPFAAAYATVPMAIMAVYLLIAKRLGAFENL